MNEELNNLIDDILKEKLKLHYENEELEAQGKLIKELCKEIERLNTTIQSNINSYNKLAKNSSDLEDRIDKAIEYAIKRQEWLMNCNYSKIGTHNYINFALEIIDILKGSDKE